MSKRFIMIVVIYSLVFSAFAICAKGQQMPAGNELMKEVLKQDSILFTAFNQRDAVQFGNKFSKDLEFFHDKGGLTNYDYTINALKNLVAQKNDLKRELIKSKTEVYPIPGYGAIQTGEHRFGHTENGKMEYGTFKFLHIWKYNAGEWIITRVVSYNH